VTSLSYKSFMQEVEARLSKMSKTEIKQLIIHWASKELPAHRHAFINNLILPVQQVATEVDDKALMDEIEAFGRRVESGDYCDGWGWDDAIYEERDWGDEGWVDEADNFLVEARELLLNGGYKQAKEAYSRLFEILEKGEEPGHLPGDRNSFDMLEVDIEEHLALYLRAIYLDSPPSERQANLFETINEYNYLARDIGLEDIINALDTDLPDFDLFLNGWVKFLEDQNKIKVGRLLREAVVLQGGVDAIAVLARKNAELYPRAYLDWINALGEEGGAEAVIAVAREGLATIPKDYVVRAEVAEIISRYGEKLNDNYLKLEGYKESFYSDPSISYLLDLYGIAIECDCLETIQNQAEQRLWELFKQDRGHVDYSYHHADLSSAYLSDNILYRALVLGGRYIELFELCKGKGSLGWSGGNNPKPFFVTFTMYLLSGNGTHLKVTEKQLNNLMTGSFYGLDNEQATKYKKIISLTSRSIELTEEQEEYYLKWCTKEIGKRVDGIVANQYRSSYYKAADLLVAMAETFTNRGEKQKGANFIEKYRSKYPKHSAFKRELTQSMNESGLFA